jgi:nicotinamide mononucleotide adenylyltransferase
MIKHSLLELGVEPERYDIIPVGFYDSTPALIASVVSLSPPFQRVYTANPQIVSLFSSWNYEVRPTCPHLTSGTEVRGKIAMGEPWEELVPRPVARFLHRIEGVQRLKLLLASTQRGESH